MIEKINHIQLEIENANINCPDDLENFRLQFLSKKGSLSLLFDEFKTISGIRKQ